MSEAAPSILTSPSSPHRGQSSIAAIPGATERLPSLGWGGWRQPSGSLGVPHGCYLHNRRCGGGTNPSLLRPLAGEERGIGRGAKSQEEPRWAVRAFPQAVTSCERWRREIFVSSEDGEGKKEAMRVAAGTLQGAAEEAQLGRGGSEGSPGCRGPTGARGRLSLCIRQGRKGKCPSEQRRHS